MQLIAEEYRALAESRGQIRKFPAMSETISRTSWN
jgi:hypothetical protein